MNKFFDINSVGIVGASEQSGKLSNDILKYLKNFKGKKYGINPKGGSFEGIVFYKSISDLPEIVDVLVYVIPAKFIIDSLREAVSLGIKRAIIISSGFKEVGNYELEDEVKKIIKENGILLLGPNCLGYIDTYKDLNLSFGTKDVKRGNISVISQSGAMAVAITDWAINKNLGFSKIISLGNKAGIDEVDLAIELNNDKDTKVIIMYLESLERGELFLKMVREITKAKPVIVFKSGISSLGEKAALSHTGAVSSDKNILFSAFKECGVHFTNSLEEFFLLIHFFSVVDYENIPENITIITNAGGLGVITTDYTEKYNVKLGLFSEKEKDILKQGLSESSSISNPIDIIGDATSRTYRQILQNISGLGKKKTILLLLTPQSVTDVENVAHVIVEYKNSSNNYVFTSFIGGNGVEEGRKILIDNSIISYDDPENVISGLSSIISQKKWELKKDEQIEEIKFPENIEQLKIGIKKESKIVSTELVNKIFKSFDINILEDFVASDEKDVLEIYEKINSKNIVAKISSEDIAHKSDVGGIVLNIKSKEEAIEAYKNIVNNVKLKVPKAKILGVSFSKMITGGNREIFLGFKRDKSFGNVLIVGMGGVYVNVFEDVQIGVGIQSKQNILKMIEKLKYYPILDGARGKDKIDIDNLVEMIYNTQFLFDELKDIIEIDINPIICNQKENIIVDAKIYI